MKNKLPPTNKVLHHVTKIQILVDMELLVIPVNRTTRV